MEDEMKRCFDELGLTAIKLHCGTHAVSVEDQRYRKAFVIANERHAPVLVHGGPSAAFLRGLLSDYPNLYFILAHVGGSTPDGMGQMIEVAREFPNLIFDLASSVCHRGFLAIRRFAVGELMVSQSNWFKSNCLRFGFSYHGFRLAIGTSSTWVNL